MNQKTYLKEADKGYAVFEKGYVIMRWWYFWFLIMPFFISFGILITMIIINN